MNEKQIKMRNSRKGTTIRDLERMAFDLNENLSVSKRKKDWLAGWKSLLARATWAPFGALTVNSNMEKERNTQFDRE